MAPKQPNNLNASRTDRRENGRGGGGADICIVGGAGARRAPSWPWCWRARGAASGFTTSTEDALAKIQDGVMPFAEADAEPLLQQVLSEGRLFPSARRAGFHRRRGDGHRHHRHADRRVSQSRKCGSSRSGLTSRCLILRTVSWLSCHSTVYPGTTQWLEKHLVKGAAILLLDVDCPERIVQGFASPRAAIASRKSSAAPSLEAEEAAAAVFSTIAPQVVRLNAAGGRVPAKLFANAYRYIEFAIANQFYTIAHSAGVDYNHILDGSSSRTIRAGHGLTARAGFTAGPRASSRTRCSLPPFRRTSCPLDHAAMLVNEGLVLYLVDDLKRKYPL